MKAKLSSIWRVAIVLVLVLSFSLIPALPAAAAPHTSVTLTATANATAEWSTTQAKDDTYSIKLKTLGDVGVGREGRIVIAMAPGTTLNDISSVSWWEYLVAGYPPHVDIRVDINGDGVGEDVLVVEYAYNGHIGEGQPTYGALTGAWYQTFSDDGNGPTSIDGNAYAWLGSGPAGGPGIIGGTLTQWKAGTVQSSVSRNTVVTALEIEVDNWMANTEAYVDQIMINNASAFLMLNAAYYKTGDTVAVTVYYPSANTSASVAQIISVLATSTTQPAGITVALTETGVNTGVFAGSFTLVNTSPGAGQLLVNTSDTITVTYATPNPDYDATATVDDISPVIAFNTVTTPTNAATQNITGTYTESNLQSIALTVNSVAKAVTYSGGIWQNTTNSTLAEGTNSIVVTIVDKVAHQATASTSINRDTAVPAITGLTPANSANVSDPTPTISATLSDANSGINSATIVLKLDTVTKTHSYAGGVVSYTPSDNLSDGAHTVTIDVSDLAGNAAVQASSTFTVDATAPVIAINALTTPTRVASANVTGTYTETHVQSIALTVNSTPNTVTYSGGNWGLSANTTLSEGNNLVLVTITDMAGNAASANTTVRLDTIAPAVTGAVVSPAIIQPATSANVTFSATVTDTGGSGVATVTINLSSIGGSATQAMTGSGTTYTYNNPTLSVTAAADYPLTVTATDAAGNSDNATAITLRIVADAIAPVISSPAITYPFSLSSARPTDNVTISATVTDDIALGTVTAASSAFTGTVSMTSSGGNTYTGTGTIASVANGNYTVTITATDAAGNPATSNITCAVNLALTGSSISLGSGWNLISLPLVTDNTSIDFILAGISANVSQVRTFVYENGVLTEKVWVNGGPAGFTEMVDGQGYWIQMSAANTLIVSGTEMPPAPATPRAYNVYSGWNLIGFKSLASKTASTYLGAAITTNFERMYSYNAAGSVYDTILTGSSLTPGRGYWLAVSANGIIYP